MFVEDESNKFNKYLDLIFDDIFFRPSRLRLTSQTILGL